MQQRGFGIPADVRNSKEMADFKKLRVWKRAHSLALVTHQTALTIRGSQYASLRSQIIRAAMSIPANIVEGREQKSEAEFCRFLRYALSSASELEYHLIMGRDIKVISETDFVGVLTQLKEVHDALRPPEVPGSTSIPPNSE
jgi:four helix bundle protein